MTNVIFELLVGNAVRSACSASWYGNIFKYTYTHQGAYVRTYVTSLPNAHYQSTIKYSGDLLLAWLFLFMTQKQTVLVKLEEYDFRVDEKWYKWKGLDCDRVRRLIIIFFVSFIL